MNQLATDPTLADAPLPVEDTGSLADHEAAYSPRRGRETPIVPPTRPVVAAPEPATLADPSASPDLGDAARDAALQAEADARDPNGRFRPKHRAKSQLARAEDVPRIKELTRKLKEAEEKLAAVTTAPPAQVTPPVSGVVAASPVAPTRAEPVAERFTFPTYDQAVTHNPNLAYEDWQDARDDAKYAWRDAQRQARESASQQQQSQHALVNAITTKVQAFRASHPDYDQLVQSVAHEQAPDLLMAALTAEQGDKFPELVYYLLTHPVDRHEMTLITDGKPVTDQHVALVRRILDTRMQAGSTGAVAPPSPIARTPKPPTPVRTGPLKTGEDPPGDGASLADHERFYYKPRRSR